MSVSGYIREDDGLCPDYCSVADIHWSEYGGAGTQHGTTADYRVPPFSGQPAVIPPPADRSEGDLVINGDIIAHHCCFADHNGRTVINKYSAAQRGTRMDLRTGERPGTCHQGARGQPRASLMEQVRHAVDAQGGQCWMQQGFRERLYGRVTLDNGADVLDEKADQIRRSVSLWQVGLPGRIRPPAFGHEPGGEDIPRL
jgi:hypothetical protein